MWWRNALAKIGRADAEESSCFESGSEHYLRRSIHSTMCVCVFLVFGYSWKRMVRESLLNLKHSHYSFEWHTKAERASHTFAAVRFIYCVGFCCKHYYEMLKSVRVRVKLCVKANQRSINPKWRWSAYTHRTDVF